MPQPEWIVRRRPEVAIRETPGGALLVDLTTGKCWQLNRIGADFLAEIESEKSVDEACRNLWPRYQVERRVLEQDILGLTHELLDAGLIEKVGP